MSLGRDGNDRIAHGDGRSNKRDEAEQGKFVGADEAKDTDGLIDGERHATQRHAVDGTVVFVSPCAVGEEALGAALYLGNSLRLRGACHAGDARRELRGTSGEILSKVVEDLRAV